MIFYWALELEGDPRRPLCRDVIDGPTLFVGPANESKGERIVREERAKKICRKCSLRTECYNWAVENEERGIWGGTSREDRLIMNRQKMLFNRSRDRRIQREIRAWRLHNRGYDRFQIAKVLNVQPDTVRDYLMSQRRIHAADQDPPTAQTSTTG